MYFSPFEFSSTEYRSASESIEPALINLGRLKFEFDSAHLKYTASEVTRSYIIINSLLVLLWKLLLVLFHYWIYVGMKLR